MYKRQREQAEAETSQGMRRPERSTMPAKKMKEPSAACQLGKRGEEMGK